MTQINYSFYNDDGDVQNEGYCDSKELVEYLATQNDLRIFWGLTDTKYINTSTGMPTVKPNLLEES